MTARRHHLRHVVLCSALLLLLLGVAVLGGAETSRLGASLEFAPFALAGTFFFNRVQRGRRGEAGSASDLDAKPAESDARLSDMVHLVVLILGAACAAVAVLVPSHLAAVVWTVPVLAGSAGIHLEAIT